MSGLLHDRGANENTEYLDRTKKLWIKGQSTSMKVLYCLKLVNVLFLLHSLLPEEVFTI